MVTDVNMLDDHDRYVKLSASEQGQNISLVNM